MCFLVDFTPGTLTILELAQGSVKRYYLITSAVAVLVFPLTWVLYALDFPAHVGYLTFIAVYLVKSAVMLRMVHMDTGLPVKKYLKEALLPMLAPSFLTLAVLWHLWHLLPDGAWWNFLVLAAFDVLCMVLAAWIYGLTKGEKDYLLSKFRLK